MRRFSVRSLMAFVVVLAGFLGALRSADDVSAGATVLVAFAAVATAVMGGLTLRGAERYGWAGFAVFGGGYLAIALGPGLSDTFRPLLCTTALLDYVQSQVEAFSSSRLKSAPAPHVLRGVLVQGIDALEGVGRPDDHPAVASRRKQLAQLQPVRTRFLCAGHSFLAMFAGIGGAAVGRWFYVRRERQAQPQVGTLFKE
jgi:hypothetical protein